MSENKMVICPYDEAHKVKASRLQLHIAKCKLNHLDDNKDVCPFNATHLLERGEISHHLMNCPDRGPLDRHLAEKNLDKNNPFKGRTAVPQFSEPNFEDEETWDIGATVSVIQSRPPPGAVIEPPPMSKPSERKKLYLNLHQMQSEAGNSKTPEKEVIRQPKQKCQGEQAKVGQANSNVIQNLGLGRGKSSRIAANIFDNPRVGPSESVSYSEMVKDMNNLGLSRGSPINQGATPFFDQDDFPALGCGRGALRAPKQSVRIPGAKQGK